MPIQESMEVEDELIPAVAVIRQSKERDSKFSPETQRGGIATWADAHGHYLRKVLEEIDVPGDAFRPKLEEAVRMIEAGEARTAIFWKLDRMGREPEGLYAARGRIERAGGRVVFADEDFDLNSEAGDYLFAMFAARAKAERRRIGANWKRATRAANERGVHQGQAFGYVRPPKVGGQGVPLEVHPEEAPGVRLAFELRAEGKSWRSICDALTAAGYRPRRGSNWTTNTVTAMLANPVYLGQAKQGDLVKEGAHPALVDRELFRKANAARGVGHAKTGDWLLSGLLRCASCRYRMRGQLAGEDRGYARYICRKRHGAGVCSTGCRVGARRLEALVVEAALARHEVVMEGAHKQLDIEALDREVAEAEVGLVQLAGMVATSKFPQLLQGKVQEAEARVAEALRARDQALAVYAPEGVSMVFSLRAEWDGMGVQERREALAGLIDYIVVHPEEGAAIMWRGTSAALGPVPKTGSGQKRDGGQPAGIVPFDWSLVAALAEGEVGVPALEDAR